MVQKAVRKFEGYPQTNATMNFIAADCVSFDIMIVLNYFTLFVRIEVHQVT